MMKHILFIVVLISFTAFYSCSEDSSSSDVTRVYGTITMENTQFWPAWEDSGEVQVTIFADNVWQKSPTSFPVGPPFNFNDPYILTYEPGKTQYDYEIEVEPGTYSALAVGFNIFNQSIPADRQTATLGVYWGNPDSVSHGLIIPPFLNYPVPSDISIADGEEKRLDFKADFAFVLGWYSQP